MHAQETLLKEGWLLGVRGELIAVKAADGSPRLLLIEGWHLMTALYRCIAKHPNNPQIVETVTDGPPILRTMLQIQSNNADVE